MMSRFVFCCSTCLALIGYGSQDLALAQSPAQKQRSLEADFEGLARSFEKLATTLERQVEESVEEYGKEFETWAEQFGEEMETWAEENAGEWEAWTRENAGQFEEMAKELEQRLAGLEQKLKREFEESGLREKVERVVSEIAEASQDSLSTSDEIRRELDHTDRNDKKRVDELRQKLFERLKEDKLKKEQASQNRGGDAESNSKHKYLEQRIDEIRIALKGDLPEQKRAVLERALAQLTDLKSATVIEERQVERAQSVSAVDENRVVGQQPNWRMTVKQLESMVVAEQERHATVMERIKKELEAVNHEKNLAALEQEKLQSAQAKAHTDKDREKAELEKLRDEVRRLKKELDSIKK